MVVVIFHLDASKSFTILVIVKRLVQVPLGVLDTLLAIITAMVILHAFF